MQNGQNLSHLRHGWDWNFHSLFCSNEWSREFFFSSVPFTSHTAPVLFFLLKVKMGDIAREEW